MNGMEKLVLSGISVWFLLGGCSMGFVPTGLTPAKAYGEYWTKPGMTVESWRRDWLGCGGMSDGGYVSDASSGLATDVLINSGKQKRQSLATCMKSKGYEYRYTGPT